MDTKEKIVHEAAVLFRTYGIKTVTMDMLATNLGISKRTIYELFRDKEELVMGVMSWMKVKHKEVITRIFSESEHVIEAIFKLLDLMDDHFSKMNPSFQKEIRHFHSGEAGKSEDKEDILYLDGNRMFLERGIREGIFRSDLNIEIISKYMLEVARIANDRNVFPPDEFISADITRNLYINFLRGIASQKGLKLIDQFDRRS